jgi:hypothetical protein
LYVILLGFVQVVPLIKGRLSDDEWAEGKWFWKSSTQAVQLRYLLTKRLAGPRLTAGPHRAD